MKLALILGLKVKGFHKNYGYQNLYEFLMLKKIWAAFFLEQ